MRQTERHSLRRWVSPLPSGASKPENYLHQDRLRSQAQRELLRDLAASSDAHRHITKQSQRLTQGKKLAHCKIVNAYDPTIAPIVKGKSNCPAQFGRKTGILSEPASGFIFANRVPVGNPSDPELCVAPARQGATRY